MGFYNDNDVMSSKKVESNTAIFHSEDLIECDNLTQTLFSPSK